MITDSNEQLHTVNPTCQTKGNGDRIPLKKKHKKKYLSSEVVGSSTQDSSPEWF